MSYTVEIRVDSYSSNNSIGIDLIPHTFLVVTGPDGVERGYGFAPEQTGLSGPGNVQDDTRHPYDASSGKFTISESQYNDLMDYINRTDAVSPPYALPFGSQCTNWALAGLAEAEIIPSVLGPSMEPTNIFFDFAKTLIFNPVWQKIGFEINDFFAAARGMWRTSPLVVDLDGDGIETVGRPVTTRCSSTTTATASRPAPAGSRRTTGCWCGIAMAMARSTTAANCSA